MPKIDSRYKKILLITAAVCALLFALAAVLSRGIQRDASYGGEHPLRISEIMARNLSYANAEGVVCDWVEIVNSSEQDFDLSGYHLSDDYTGAKYAFPVGTVLKSGGYIVVWCIPDAVGELTAPFALSRQGGESLVLSNSRNFIVDEVSTIPSRKNCSLIRQADGSLAVCAEPTPGYDNTEEGYALYLAANGRSAGGLRLSEIMNANSVWTDENGLACDWIELTNVSDEPVALAGYALSDAEGVAKYSFTTERVLQPGEFTVVWCSTEAAGDYAPFGLRGYGGEAVTLMSPDGTVVDRVETVRTGGDHSLALVNGSWVTRLAPTPGYENSAAGFEALLAARGCVTEGAVVTKVSPRNKTGPADADGDVCDWVEIQNTGGGTLSLLGWYLSDTESEPTRWALPDVRLAPGESVTVFASGKDRKTGELHTDFRLSEEETLTLTSPAGQLVCSVPCQTEDDGVLTRGDDGTYRAVLPGKGG